MTRHEFLETLAEALGTLPQEFKTEILGDFSEHFDVGLAEGKSEAFIAAALGDPKRIAKLYFADEAVRRAHQRASLKNTLSMVFAVLRFKLGGGLMVAAAYFLSLVLTALIYAGAVVLLLAAVGFMALGAASAIKGMWIYFAFYLFAMLLFVSAGALTLSGGAAFFKNTVGKMPLFAQRMMKNAKDGGNAHA